MKNLIIVVARPGRKGRLFMKIYKLLFGWVLHPQSLNDFDICMMYLGVIILCGGIVYLIYRRDKRNENRK